MLAHCLPIMYPMRLHCIALLIRLLLRLLSCKVHKILLMLLLMDVLGLSMMAMRL